ncbi:MAG TPA: hypothetical protein VNO34_01920 [Actinomycetota bacterium]|nr:hypothetical protein [Actinomycetota bacterium]
MTRPRQWLAEVHARIEAAIRDWHDLLRQWEEENERDPVGAIAKLDERRSQRRAIEKTLERLWVEKRLAMIGEDVALAHLILAKMEGR